MPKNKPDIQMTFTARGINGSKGKPKGVSPKILSNIESVINTELTIGMNLLANEIYEALKSDYTSYLRTHKRTGESDLREAIMESIEAEVQIRKDYYGVNAFNLDKAKRLTMYTSPFGQTYDIFSLVEGGTNRSGRVYGSKKYGFLSVEFADKMADLAIRLFELKAEESQSLKKTVSKMGGKSGEGIMVRLRDPLFFELPQFGLAKEFVSPHPGFLQWGVLRGFDGPEKYKGEGDVRDWAVSAINRMFERAARKLANTI